MSGAREMINNRRLDLEDRSADCCTVKEIDVRPCHGVVVVRALARAPMPSDDGASRLL